MARTYTVLAYPERTVYKGFDKRFYPKELKHVLLSLVEGDIDILGIDDPNDYRDALKYLENMYGDEGFVVIGPFSEAPFVVSIDPAAWDQNPVVTSFEIAPPE